MILFLDTEFTNLKEPELISLALVSLDGEFTFYGERTDFDYGACSDFVQAKVWANLGMFPEAKAKLLPLRARLNEWCAALPMPATLAYDSDCDVDLLLATLGPSHALSLAGRVDLRPTLERKEYKDALRRFHAQGVPRHHALFDAQAHRAGWSAVPGNLPAGGNRA